MNFTISQEQTMLKDALTRFLKDRYSFEQRRTILETDGYSADIWADFATSLGIIGAALPEAAGGLAGGPVETMIVMEALGAALVLEPYLETAVIGGGLLKRDTGATAAALLRAVVAGDARTALAAGEPTSRYAPNNVSTLARRDGDGWRIAGDKSVVVSAPMATHYLVVARTAGERCDRDGISVFIMPAGTPGILRHDYRLIDGRTASDIRFDDVAVPADGLLGEAGAALPLVEQVLDEATAAICSEAVGGMRRMLDDTVAYTKQRRQFGQPLSNFQVLQHRMVDMYMALELAVSAVYLATLRLDADPVTRAQAVSAAKATIAKSARMIGENAVQLHGGMGMTDELAVGHYFKRATTISGEFGTADYHIARYGALDQTRAA